MADVPTAAGAEEFLTLRREQEVAHMRHSAGRDPMDSLLCVELNPTELCNRKCPFCPRVNPAIYPNRNLQMTVEVAGKVAHDLAEIGSKCRISVTGFGEPLLNPRITELIAAVRKHLPENAIEINTNGDRLTVKRIQELFRSGISEIYVNCYDGPEQETVFRKRFAAAGVDDSCFKIRKHWPEVGPDFGLELNNRSGTIVDSDLGLKPPTDPLQRHCFYPFFKMFVDWNGDFVFCANDWGREITIGNVLETHLRDLWLSEQMRKIRSRLAHKDRSVAPCSTCTVKGDLYGGMSFKILQEHYGW